MATLRHRESRTSSRALLGRILEQPDLPSQIERLPPQALARLIDRVGLEDAGEILALASTPQIARVFDEDLWKSERPGEDETFDADRFLLWLSVMLEAGDDFVAKRLVELPEDLVTLALHRHLLVIDIDALASEMSEGGDEPSSQLEKALESTLHEEIDEYRLIARRHEGWDTLIHAVLALDKDHHDHLFRILERCCAMSTQHIEDNGGLYEVLTSEETLEVDVAAEREDRRAAEGHVAPSAAKSFLALCRTREGASASARDPLTKAYFRELSPQPLTPAKRTAKPPSTTPLQQILVEAGVTEEPQVSRLLTPGPSKDEPLLVRAMRIVGDADPRLFSERSEELAYLANVLVAGAPFRGRRLRPIEALRAVIATCSLGLHLLTRRALLDEASVSAAATMLTTTHADGLFRVAHHRLHEDIVNVARAVPATVRHACDPATAESLAALAEDLPTLPGPKFLETPLDLATALQILNSLPLEPTATKKTATQKTTIKKTATKKTATKKTVTKKTKRKST